MEHEVRSAGANMCPTVFAQHEELRHCSVDRAVESRPLVQQDKTGDAAVSSDQERYTFGFLPIAFDPAIGELSILIYFAMRTAQGGVFWEVAEVKLEQPTQDFTA